MEPVTFVLGAAATVGIGVALCTHRRAQRAETKIAKLSQELSVERHAANHDALTGLPNRRAFYDLGARLVSSPARPALLGVLIDLGGFKRVNDSLGHAAGDKVLVTIARRLASYAGDDLVARLGGDEFAGLLTARSVHPTRMRSATDGLVALLAAPIRISDQELTTTASIGVAPVWGGATLPEVLGRADAAMYRAKRSGCGAAWFDPVLDHDTARCPGIRPAVRTRDLTPTVPTPAPARIPEYAGR